ncbi:MAG: hypothetical protein NZ519_12915 [Bacteroidia bacterium]|nr:hypothetical protein [Bacteroidia bacterium]
MDKKVDSSWACPSLVQGVGHSARSPQHADLVGMSVAKRPQGHAQKILVLKLLQNSSLF